MNVDVAVDELGANRSKNRKRSKQKSRAGDGAPSPSSAHPSEARLSTGSQSTDQKITKHMLANGARRGDACQVAGADRRGSEPSKSTRPTAVQALVGDSDRKEKKARWKRRSKDKQRHPLSA